MNTLIVLTALLACGFAAPQAYHHGGPHLVHAAPQADAHPAITLAGNSVPEETPAVQAAKAEFFARFNQEVATHAHEDHAYGAHPVQVASPATYGYNGLNNFNNYAGAPYAYGFNGLNYNGLGYQGGYNLGYNNRFHGYNNLYAHNNYLAPNLYNNQYAVAAPAVHGAYVHAAPSAIHGYAPGYSTQHASQDVYGAGEFGYSTPDQTHEQSRDAYGNVQGAYSYVDPTGKVVQTSYTADAVHGFRVASNALPVGPVAGPVHLATGPLPVQDTPEVAAAKADFFRTYAEAEARAAY